MADDESSSKSYRKEEFHDVADDFPFHDCGEAFAEPIESHGSASISAGDPNQDEPPSQAGIRSCRSYSRDKSFCTDSNEGSKAKSSMSLKNELNSGERRIRLSQKIRDLGHKTEESDSSEIKQMSERPNDALGAEKDEKNALGAEKDEKNGERSTLMSGENDNGEESSLRETNGTDSSLLLTFVGIVIKLIGFQIDLFLNLFLFPVRLVYYLYMLVFDPFGLWMRCKQYFVLKLKGILGSAFKAVSRYAYEWFKEKQAIWKLGLKCGWALLWAAYVCALLVVLLISAFVMGGILIRMVVVEPVRINRSLNFDYAEKSPVAFVPLTTEPELSDDIYIGEKGEFGMASESRVIPHNHKLKVAVLLTLPESDYNRNLGIFQVRIDFLAADGKTLASSKRQCMLQFRSQPIHLLLTFFKLAPLLTGYTSETQNLKVKLRGFTEGNVPTAYVRVVIEQRAEFLPGAGIPEIYEASLFLESELPLMLNVLWFWKTTLFVWISMAIFGMELFLALLCCKPLVLPKIPLWKSTNRGASQNARPGRR